MVDRGETSGGMCGPSLAQRRLVRRALERPTALRRFDSADEFSKEARASPKRAPKTAASAALVQHALVEPARMRRFDSADYFGPTEDLAAAPAPRTPPERAGRGLGRRWAWLAAGACVRQLVGLNAYSGAGTPPRYGDYEAHRHWMEITVALPVEEWYSYDAQYWGLDYPPLTAYLERLFGYASRLYEPASVLFEQSRGYETPSHKRFMRFTSLVVDLACSLSALPASTNAALSPAPVLVDHGHFQYNALPLGLTAWSAKALHAGRALLSAFLFCLALNSKQTALYYAPAVFFEFLARSSSLRDVLRVGLVVIATFALIWAPLGASAPAALGRCFPVERGVFQDKVANFWYAAQVLLRARDRLAPRVLVAAATCATALFAFPVPVARCVRRAADFQGFLLSLHLSALAFFLFSYHVHEKAILVPLAPLLLLGPDSTLATYRDAFSLAAAVSVSPLLFFENLAAPYLATLLLFILTLDDTRLRRLAALLVFPIVSALSALPLLLPVADTRFPDLYPALTALFFAALFGAACLLLNLLELSRLLLARPSTFRAATKQHS